MKGMKGIQRSSHPELTRMVKLLRKQNLGLHDEKKELVAMNAELVDVLKLADTSLKQVGFRDETFVIGSIKATLAKVKELNHEG